MDAYRVGDNFVAHFDLPGVDPGSIEPVISYARTRARHNDT